MTKRNFKRMYTAPYAVPLALSMAVFSAFAADVSSVTTGKNGSGGYEVQIGGSGFGKVRSYSLNNPARIVVDIPNAKSHLLEKITEVTHPVVSSVAVIEGDDRVRATINLAKAMPYDIVEKDNRITVVVKDTHSVSSQNTKTKRSTVGGQNRFAAVDFRRGNEGQGSVRIMLPNDNTVVDVQRVGNRVVAKLQGAAFAKTKRLNVNDFNTPVRSVDIYKNQLSIATNSDAFEIVSYQSDNVFSIEFNKPNEDALANQALLPGDSNKKYTGEPLSLNFQDIDVRAVLQLIGDFTNTNVVVSDAVSGSITLRLNNVPWDQALDIILQTKGLSKQENGDVIYIAPSADIAANKRAAYEVANVEKELAPIQQQLIQVQYARAENLEKIIEDTKKSGSKNNKTQVTDSLLSNRGSVSVDARTNTLIINDVPSSIEKVRRLVAKLDVAVNQVLIDARIVTASNNFAHELGVRWGGAFVGATDDVAFGGAGNLAGADAITSSANQNIANTGQAFPTTVPNLANRLGVNLAAAKPTGSIGLSLLGSDFLVDLELSAMQDEGRGEIISSPRVIAQDGGEATIEQGTQLAYNKLDQSGNTVTEWKDIPLKLTVRPKIAPNNKVDLDLEIRKDSPGTVFNGEPSIDTNSIVTQVLVDNGETVVLGGVYEQRKTKSVSKVPVLGDLPLVGRAFRRDSNEVRKNELLIFVTPKIIDKRYTSRDKFVEIRD
ncbi:MAG: pilus assembly protein PilQ [Gammaproteobacteria bacterium]|nr:MAG: pilus assembly protein PilQ [Gammaproteobacteria bacterium]